MAEITYPIDKGYSLVYSLSLGFKTMQSANAKKFRAELKDYMDAAATQPVRINRRDGQSFILMSEQIYEGFREEILSLQRRLLAMNEMMDGKAKPLTRGDDRLARFKSKK